MKKIAIIVSIITVLLTISFFFVEKKVFSELENRNLQTFPEYSWDDLISGKYINKLEDYITDHFPLRNMFMNINSSYQVLIGKKEINNVYLGKEGYLFEKYNSNYEIDKIINTFNEFNNNNDIDLTLMFIPSSGLINNNLLPSNISFDKQNNDLDYFYSNINFNYIDLRDSYIKENTINELYFKTDHHYNSYGSYLAYLNYITSNNELAIDYEVDILSKEFYGTLYSKVTLNSYESDIFSAYNTNNIISVVYNETNKVNTIYKEDYLDKKDKYSYYFGGNDALIEITTNITNGKEILLIKDSYANSLVPYLTNHYEKITLIDLRYYNAPITSYIKENNINEVLILYGINNLSIDTSINKMK